ncbi:MAG: acyl carrier protein [Myxococcota bacterium]
MSAHASLRDDIIALARKELSLDGPLPDGDLSEALDSIQKLSLIVAIEDHYEICFDPEDDAEVVSLDDVTRLVHAKLQATDGSQT